MNAPSKQELQIVKAFSSLAVPDRVFRESNIKELVQEMVKEQGAVQDDSDKLQRLRREKEEGNFLGNWWHDRDDKVQDAQLDLSTSIGRLTKTSSRLLVVNTAISKVLCDQQNLLLQQQAILEEQARAIKKQNDNILAQQQQLAEQQEKINAANKGLMEAKGVTQEQATQLVGCVKRVTEAELKIEQANDLLRITVQAELQESLDQCAATVNAGVTQATRVQEESERRIEALVAEGIRENGESLANSATKLRDDVIAKLGGLLVPLEEKITTQHLDLNRLGKSFEQKLQQQSDGIIRRIEAMQAEHAGTTKRAGWAIATVAAISVLSLCLQLGSKLAAG